MCKADIYKDVCTSCGRTLTQIEEWSSYSKERRSEIMKSLKKKTPEKEHPNGKDTRDSMRGV
jgi:predicted Fe-S protein YdhL (DUF1289 family)